jgi:hypothetical protein
MDWLRNFVALLDTNEHKQHEHEEVKPGNN